MTITLMIELIKIQQWLKYTRVKKKEEYRKKRSVGVQPSGLPTRWFPLLDLLTRPLAEGRVD